MDYNNVKLYLKNSLNTFSSPKCLFYQPNFFISLMKFVFDFILIGNTICYMLFLIIMTITGIFHFIYTLRPHMQEQRIFIEGFTDEEMETLPRVKYNLNKKYFYLYTSLLSKSLEVFCYIEQKQLYAEKDDQEELVCPVCLISFNDQEICL